MLLESGRKRVKRKREGRGRSVGLAWVPIHSAGFSDGVEKRRISSWREKKKKKKDDTTALTGIAGITMAPSPTLRRGRGGKVKKRGKEKEGRGLRPILKKIRKTGGKKKVEEGNIKEKKEGRERWRHAIDRESRKVTRAERG